MINDLNITNVLFIIMNNILVTETEIDNWAIDLKSKFKEITGDDMTPEKEIEIRHEIKRKITCFFWAADILCFGVNLLRKDELS